jgi:hypothetical protein
MDAKDEAESAEEDVWNDVDKTDPQLATPRIDERSQLVYRSPA